MKSHVNYLSKSFKNKAFAELRDVLVAEYEKIREDERTNMARRIFKVSFFRSGKRGNDMTLKELSQLYWLNREIEQDKEKLEKLKATVSSPASPNISGLPSSNNDGTRIERYIEEIVDLEAIISAKITQCMHERNRLERYISGIPDSLTRQIFALRFINNLTWMQVAVSVGNNTEDSVKKRCYRYIKSQKNF